MNNLSKNKITKIFSNYEKDGYAKLGKIVSNNALENLKKRTIDLMLGRKVYKGMFFQLDSEDGKYANINTKDESYQGPSFRYRKIKDLEYDDLFLRLIKSKLINKFSKKYIGRDVSCMRAMILNKPSMGSSELDYHQDVSRDWNMSGKPTFTFWMSINGANKKNGCLKVIKSSHKYGTLDKGHFIKTNKNYFKKHKILNVELKPGEAIIFNNQLFHGSGKNYTKKMRLAFTACLMDANIFHMKYKKRYPKIFGKNSLTLKKIKNFHRIPKKVYEK
tara:strand:+ start:232 stop:1056 length:825 start_codon:yes stop_codon:yes gene_type:complete